MTCDAVLFDLLSGLLDSWSLWNRVAGDVERGYHWRARYLELTAATGAYRPYEGIVAAAAADVGLPESVTPALLAQWPSVRPWPEAPAVLAALAGNRSLGVVTNCSRGLAATAVHALSIPLSLVVTAEEVGWYKPHLAPYAAALDALDLTADRVLYVAASPFDVVGAAEAGMAVYWHNRRHLDHAAAEEAASWVAESLSDVPRAVAEARAT